MAASWLFGAPPKKCLKMAWNAFKTQLIFQILILRHPYDTA